MAQPRTKRDVLAYKNGMFMDTSAGRPLRILSEYLEPLDRFRKQRIRDTIVFFGSARIKDEGPMARFYQEARELARRLTLWSESLPHDARRFVVCTGGGPGIMEAANRGAADEGGQTIGLNIGLPFEQMPNPYITPELSFEFHYFFMRKFWFAYLAKALVVFPGGFGTLDELCELLTLAQTRKLEKKIVILLYGTQFWKEVLNLDALVRYGMISPEDLDLFHTVDDLDAAMEYLTGGLTQYYLGPDKLVPAPMMLDAPDIARSRR
jgi:hypothetical protein